MDTEVLEKSHKTTGTFFRKATRDDLEIVVNILSRTFKNDPHMNWLLEKCHNTEKLKIMMTYLFYKTLSIGDIYLSKDEQAVALWKSEKKEVFSLDYLMRNLRFFIEIGMTSILRILENERFTYRQYPKRKKYFHLYLIGVLPECQGKGYANRMLSPILDNNAKKSIPVYLETANVTNVKIYEKKGFKVYNSWLKPGLELYYMRS